MDRAPVSPVAQLDVAPTADSSRLRHVRVVLVGILVGLLLALAAGNAAAAESGSISGKVTNASTLAAVEGVYVCALTSADEDRGCTSTDSAGVYTLTGLAAGEYRVVFIAPEAANFAPQYYEGKAKFAEADRRVGDRGVHDDGYRRGADGRRADHRHRHRRRNESPTRGCRGVRL